MYRFQLQTLEDDFKERKKKNTPYSEEEIIRHFYSLVCGVEYLHSKKTFHGDIQPDNLLLDNNGALKIRDVEDEDSDQTYQYSAPEVLGEKPTKEADIWSIGVVILELCLFESRLLNSALSQKKLQNKLDKLFKNLEGKYHSSLRVLLKKLLNLDPEERPDIAQIKADLEKDFPKIIVCFSSASLIDFSVGK